ncbi:hypothetical protein [Sporolactobacillus putidus]|uniref:hypothetical protein n=1 Tax=Sporolactobacillus putidus TaxID=492735 RepID=UPI001E619078|nr:hypothetical protein [Sporolactobacillus putidus]
MFIGHAKSFGFGYQIQSRVAFPIPLIQTTKCRNGQEIAIQQEQHPAEHLSCRKTLVDHLHRMRAPFFIAVFPMTYGLYAVVKTKSER